MVRIRLRTKFLLSSVLISIGLTCAALLIVRHSVQIEVRRQIVGDVLNSVSTFRNFLRQREVTLTRSAELIASLPNLRALMTTQHTATIQDASSDLWRLAGSDLFALADRAGNIVALHTPTSGFTRTTAQELLRRSLEEDVLRHWWFDGNNLYEVFLQPIYFGSPAENNLFGILAVGHEIDEKVAEEVSRIASSQVAFRYGNTLVVSTLPPDQEAELVPQMNHPAGRESLKPIEVRLGGERFLATSIELAPGALTPVRLSVLKSYDKATVFLARLNRLVLGLGLLAVLVGAALVFLISHTFTRPLANLVAGVRALETGDFKYPLAAKGGDEMAEVTAAFDRMRCSLALTQQQLLHAERLATIGRMASSISHDLRHPLTAIVANSEFLCNGKLDGKQREELYQEIRTAVDQTTDLIDSLLEFSRARESLRRVYGSLEESIEHAVLTVRTRPEFHGVNIDLSREGPSEGWFDPQELERVFTNLLLNACQAVPLEAGKVEVNLRQAGNGVEVRIIDNGPGVPEPIRDKLFEPFISHGKQNGTGLGLVVVQKIFRDHGGDVSLESSEPGRTVFKLVLPLFRPSDLSPAA